MRQLNLETRQNIFLKAIEIVLLPLIAAGIAWIVYTTVETKTDIQLLKYQVEQINKNVEKLSK